jgi:hypothetical protein
MERLEYYDKMVKKLVVAGMAVFFGIGNAIACCFI